MTRDELDRKAVGGAKGMYGRIVRNSVVLSTGMAASSFFLMLSVAIAARALAAREFGVLVLLQSSALMLSALASFSTQQGVIKLGAEAQAGDDKVRLGVVISMGLLVDLVASALAFLIAGLAIEISSARIGLSKQDLGSAWILAFSLLFTGYPTANGIFRLYDRFGLFSLVQTLAAACLFIVYAVLFMLGAKLQQFICVLAIYLGGNSLLQLLLSLYLLRRDHVPIRLGIGAFSGPDGRTLLHYCWSTWGTSTATTIRTNGDSLLVGAIISVEAAGVYNAARQLAGIIRKFNSVYTSTVFPEIARLGSRADIDGARKLNRRMLVAGIAIGAAAVFLAAIFGALMIKLLFGARFGLAYQPFVLLTAAAVAQLISETPSMCVQVFRGPRFLLALNLAAVIVFVVAALALTWMLSISGMALAQLIFSVFLGILCNVALKRTVGTGTAVEREAFDDL